MESKTCYLLCIHKIHLKHFGMSHFCFCYTVGVLSIDSLFQLEVLLPKLINFSYLKSICIINLWMKGVEQLCLEYSIIKECIVWQAFQL